MKRVLVTGSAGHLGEALTRVLRGDGYEVAGLDLRASPGTDVVGSITERALVRECLDGASAVLQFLYRRADLQDVADAHLRAMERAAYWTG